MGDSDVGEAGERELRAVGRHEWEQIIKRSRFDGLIGGKSGRVEGKAGRGGVSGTTVKAVALALASYADGDTGRNVRPGDATVAVDVETSMLTVSLVKKKLVELGLLRRTRAGARRLGDPDVYQLTLPSDLLDVLEVLTPAAVRVAAARLAEAKRGKRKVSVGSPTTTPPASAGDSMGDPEDTAQAVDNSNVGDPQDTAHPDPADGCAVSAGYAQDGCAVSGGSVVRYPEDPPTNQDQPPNLTNHSDGDLRTDLAVARATAPVQDPISMVVSGVADARPGQGSGDQPERCDHGLPVAHRGDGKLACPLCRRGLPAAAAHEPDVGAARATGGRLAPVIPLRRKVVNA